jgi:hypothetical protein
MQPSPRPSYLGHSDITLLYLNFGNTKDFFFNLRLSGLRCSCQCKLLWRLPKLISVPITYKNDMPSLTSSAVITFMKPLTFSSFMHVLNICGWLFENTQKIKTLSYKYNNKNSSRCRMKKLLRKAVLYFARRIGERTVT